MKDLKVDRKTLPDWQEVKSLVLVYPYKLPGREHLLNFYNQFLTYVPTEIKIILIVKDKLAEKEIERLKIELGINNSIEFQVFPRLFDIWIRDYAPLITEDRTYYFPVKFNYNPSYIQKNFAKNVGEDNIIEEELGKRYIDEGIRSIDFYWDMGNLTHNGAGTAIVSNQLIADNKTIHIERVLKPTLHVFCGFDRIIFVPTEPGDQTGHVDGMVRFIDEKVVVVGSYPVGSPNRSFMELFARNLNEIMGDEFKIIRLENGALENTENEGLSSAYGNHVNFLRLGNKILFPYYGQDISERTYKDFRSQIEAAGLSLEIIPVDIPEIKDLARLGGVLNCITWQICK